ncbi:hypothetical protein T261_06494 [Streptomyces lydicus]|nr:hypothetical protein T261_06494 [Streptomyces lydicus]
MVPDRSLSVVTEVRNRLREISWISLREISWIARIAAGTNTEQTP